MRLRPEVGAVPAGGGVRNTYPAHGQDSGRTHLDHILHGWGNRKTCFTPALTDMDILLFAAAEELFERTCRRRVRVKGMRLVLGRITDTDRQLRLFPARGAWEKTQKITALQGALDQVREAGIQPIIGAEADAGGYRAVILARNTDGYSNLCRLLSDLHCKKGFHLPGALENYREGLIVISDDSKLISYLRKYSSGNLFVEMSPGHLMHRALALAGRFRLPPVATSRAVLLNESDHEIHRVLRAIALNKKLSRLSADDQASEMDVLLSPDRIADLYPHCPEALENAAAIAQECVADWDFQGTIFPPFRDMDRDEAICELEKRTRQGALRRYGTISDNIERRLKKELSLIRDKGFAHYFLVVEELVDPEPPCANWQKYTVSPRMR